MKYFLLIGFASVISASAAFGQVLIDHSINLTGTTPGDARIMGIKEVSAPQDAVSAEALQKGGLIYASVTGGPNSYTISFSPTISTPYSEGMVVIFKANGDNTAAVTLNGISLRKDVSVPLAAGDIKNNQIVTVAYDGANFQLVSRAAVSTGSVTSVSTAAANNGVTATWATPTTTPALTIGLGNITPTSVATTGTITGSNLSGTNTGDQTLAGLGGVPTTRTITINGTAQNLSADRTWSVGTVTSVSTAAANNGVTATWSMASPTPALTIGLGAITPTSVAATGTVTGSNLSGTHTGNSSGTNTGDQTLAGLGGVPTSRTITINGTTFDLSANRTWSVGTVTGSGTQNYVTKWNNAGGTALGNSLIYDNGTSVAIGHTGPLAKLDIATGALGSNAGDLVEMFRVSGNNANGTILDIRQIRTSAGSSWQSAGTRIQQKIDATWQAYMQFNGTGNDYGISFGTGGSTVSPGSVPERMKISETGNVTIANLAGTGTRAVYADNTGTLKTATSTLADWRLVLSDDFESAVTGWVSNTLTTNTTASPGAVFGRAQLTGGVNSGNWILTNYVTGGTALGVLKKGYDLSSIPHTEVWIRLSFYFIDSWDGEVAWLGASTAQNVAPDVLWQSGSYDFDAMGGPWSNSGGGVSGTWGAAANLIGLGFSERQVVIEGYFKTSGNSIWLMLGAQSLGSPNSDEGYGIDNVEIYVK